MCRLLSKLRSNANLIWKTYKIEINPIAIRKFSKVVSLFNNFPSFIIYSTKKKKELLIIIIISISPQLSEWDNFLTCFQTCFFVKTMGSQRCIFTCLFLNYSSSETISIFFSSKMQKSVKTTNIIMHPGLQRSKLFCSTVIETSNGI